MLSHQPSERSPWFAAAWTLAVVLALVVVFKVDLSGWPSWVRTLVRSMVFAVIVGAGAMKILGRRFFDRDPEST
jgi:hypothetical protein